MWRCLYSIYWLSLGFGGIYKLCWVAKGKGHNSFVSNVFLTFGYWFRGICDDFGIIWKVFGAFIFSISPQNWSMRCWLLHFFTASLRVWLCHFNNVLHYSF